jgi:rod shape-determining protein MreC
MRYVGYDQFRRQPAESRVPRRRRRGVLMPALLCVSVALMVASRLEFGLLTNAKFLFAGGAMPILRALMVPLEPVRRGGAALFSALSGAHELERLTNENQRLKEWETRARDLERQLGELGAVANAARETDVAFVTTRVTATSSGTFQRSAIINAGRNEGIKAGYPALASEGLAGQVASVASLGARLKLLTNAESRIPVYVGPNEVRAVLIGDNGPAPRLVFPEPEATANVGDEVSTSGSGGDFPRGLRVGVVRESGRRPSVTPHANLDRLDYVSILFYDPVAGDPPPRDERPQAADTEQVPQ